MHKNRAFLRGRRFIETLQQRLPVKKKIDYISSKPRFNRDLLPLTLMWITSAGLAQWVGSFRFFPMNWWWFKYVFQKIGATKKSRFIFEKALPMERKSRALKLKEISNTLTSPMEASMHLKKQLKTIPTTPTFTAQGLKRKSVRWPQQLQSWEEFTGSVL